VIENNPEDVSSAFEMLLEEVEAEIDFASGVGARSFERRDLDGAKEALERSAALTTFRDKVAGLRKEWESLTVHRQDEGPEPTDRRNLGRLRRGLRTREAEYYLPILRVLTSMGGSSKVTDVLDEVGRVMKPILKDVDHEPLASEPENPRWRNTAQWARHGMVQEGLLAADSPRGIWQITAKGRERLQSSTEAG